MPVVTTIEYEAFYGCTSLTSVDMPVVTTIEYEAFCGCTSLESVDMPRVTTIEERAFAECTALYRVTIGDSIEDIYSEAFKDIGRENFDFSEIYIKAVPHIDAEAFPYEVFIFVPWEIYGLFEYYYGGYFCTIVVDGID